MTQASKSRQPSIQEEHNKSVCLQKVILKQRDNKMCSLSGQDTYERVQTTNPYCGGYFKRYPTTDDVLDAFDVSMLNVDGSTTGPSMDASGSSQLTLYDQQLSSAYNAGSVDDAATAAAYLPGNDGFGGNYDRSWTVDGSTTTGGPAAGLELSGPAMWDPASMMSTQITAGASSADLSMFPVPGTSGLNDQSSVPTLTSPIGRKLKMYELPPQSDPEKEKKRQRAIKALKNRLKGSQRDENQQMRLMALNQEVSHLQYEKQIRQQKVADMEDCLNRLVVSPATHSYGTSSDHFQF